MICELCGKNQATTHVKSMVNGEYTEMWLCPHCAKEKASAVCLHILQQILAAF